MSEIEEMTRAIVDFREKRDWAQFHHPKELASALAIEVAEIMELFRFKSPEEVSQLLKEESFRTEVGAELADTLFLLLLLAHDCRVDIKEAFRRKMSVLEERYPEELSRGRNAKWTDYTESTASKAT